MYYVLQSSMQIDFHTNSTGELVIHSQNNLNTIMLYKNRQISTRQKKGARQDNVINTLTKFYLTKQKPATTKPWTIRKSKSDTLVAIIEGFSGALLSN